MSNTDKVNLTNWFFIRLQGIYSSKYAAQFGNKADLAIIKREWAGDICKFSQTTLDKKLSFAKANMHHKLYEWPNIGAILTTPVNSPTGMNSDAYVDQSHQLPARQRDKAQDIGRMKAIRDLMPH